MATPMTPESAHKDPHGADAAPGKEAHETKNETKHDAGKTVEEKTKETKKAVHDVVPDAKHDEHAHDEHAAHDAHEKPAYRSLPRAPSLSTVAKGAALPAAVLAPGVVLPGAAGLWAGKKLWNLASRVPGLNLITRGVEKTASGVQEGVQSLGSVAAYPFKLGLAAATNTLKFGYHNIVRPPLRLLKFIGTELYVDTRKVVEILAGIPHDKMNPVNLLTGTVGIVTNGVKNFGGWCWHHPKTAIIGGVVIGSYIATYGFGPGLSTFANDVFTAFKGILNGLATWGGKVPLPKIGVPGI